jgi:hypothetical protein
MDIYEETKVLLQLVDKIQEQNNKDNPFKGFEVRKLTVDSKLQSSNQLNKNKKPFRITNLFTVIEFLDLTSILNLSVVNRQCYHFLKSVYFYKFINKSIEFNKQKKCKKDENKKKEITEEGIGLLGKISNYFGTINVI